MSTVSNASETGEVRSAGALSRADGAAMGSVVRHRDHSARVVSARVRLRPRLREIWRSRELLLFLVRKELKVKYKGSVLGFFWSMLNPAVVLVVYWLVFTYFLKSGIPQFAIYLFSGLLVWNFFSVSLITSANSVVANAGIVKKVSFPREILAISQVGTSLVFLGFQLIVLVVFLLGFRYAPDWSYLPLIPFAVVDLVILTTALAIALSAINVYLRDVEHLIQVLMTVWFWGVPIIYSFNKVYHHAKWLGYLFLADPVTPLVLSFQRAIYGDVAPAGCGVVLKHGRAVVIRGVQSVCPGAVLANYPYHFYLAMLGWVLLGGLALLALALYVFGRIEGNFAEEL
jgi:ABC-2 type transport system permease protein